MKKFKKYVCIGSLFGLLYSSSAYGLPILVNTETENTFIEKVFTTLDCEGYDYYQIRTTYTYKVVFEKEFPGNIDYTIHTSEFEYKFLKNPCFDESVLDKPDFCTKFAERSLGGSIVFVDKNSIEIEKFFKKYKIEYVKIPFNTCKDCDNHTPVPESSNIVYASLGMFFLLMNVLIKKYKNI